MRIALSILLSLACFAIHAQGPYAPAAGVAGTDAIHKDSSIIQDWAISCSIQRAYQDIANQSLGLATVGDSSLALHKAMQNGVVSLGDGGSAILQFNGALYNGPGADFAIFENSFSDTFLELAFVEVSSDGIYYVRFPSQSLTDTISQVNGFGAVDPTNIHNLAGKYRMGYGTPFDLNNLSGINGLDIQHITHIKIIDVVGSLNANHCSRDASGRKINDPYPTPFPSGGFDLDAVGLMYIRPVGLIERDITEVRLYPNPVNDQLFLDVEERSRLTYRIYDMSGKLKLEGNVTNKNIMLEKLSSGSYIIQFEQNGIPFTKKIMKR